MELAKRARDPQAVLLTPVVFNKSDSKPSETLLPALVIIPERAFPTLKINGESVRVPIKLFRVIPPFPVVDQDVPQLTAARIVRLVPLLDPVIAGLVLITRMR